MITVTCDGCGAELPAANRNRIKVSNGYGDPAYLDYCHGCAVYHFPKLRAMLSWTAPMTLPPPPDPVAPAVRAELVGAASRAVS